MKYQIQYYNLRPGDEIIVPKSRLSIIQHHALYIGYDETGTDWIIHNVAGTGVSLITADNFFSQCLQISQIKRFAGTNYERKQLVKRSLKIVGKPYNMINYNCEHFTNEIKAGEVISRQIETVFAGLILSIIAVAIFSK